jgi:hypothetical protein
MANWKYLTGQRVQVRRSIEPLSPGDEPDNSGPLKPNDISLRLVPSEDVRGKMGTVLTRVQPVWDQNVSEGDQTLNQYEVDIDGVGSRIIIEEWLESKEQ